MYSVRGNRDPYRQEWPRQTKAKKGQFMNFSQGHSGTKVQCVNRACFPKEKHTRIRNKKMGEKSTWTFRVLALSLVWFAPGRLPKLPGRVAIQAGRALPVGGGGQNSILIISGYEKNQ